MTPRDEVAVRAELEQRKEGDKKEEEKKAVATAIDINTEIAENNILLSNIHQMQERWEKAAEEAEEAAHENRDKGTQQDQSATQEIHPEEQKIEDDAKLDDIDRALVDIDQRLASLQVIKKEVTENWIFSKGVLSTQVNDSYKAEIKDELKTAIIVQGETVTLESRLSKKLDERIEEFAKKMADPNTSKEPLHTQILIVGLRAQVNEDIAEFNKEVRQHNKEHPENTVKEVTIPPINVKKLAEFANNHYQENHADFQSNLKNFMGLDEIAKQEKELNTAKEQLLAQKAQLQPPAAVPEAPPLAPPLQSAAAGNAQIKQPPNTPPYYDPDAGTPYALNAISSKLLKEYAKDIEKEIGKEMKAKESGSLITFSIGDDGKSSLIYNKTEKTLTTNGVDEASIKAMLMMAKKVYGNQPFDLNLDPNVDPKIAEKVCKEVGVNPTIKSAEKVQATTPEKPKEAAPKEAAPTAAPSQPAPQAPAPRLR